MFIDKTITAFKKRPRTGIGATLVGLKPEQLAFCLNRHCLNKKYKNV